MKLRFVEQKTSELLADFCCGIKEMDEFIHVESIKDGSDTLRMVLYVE